MKVLLSADDTLAGKTFRFRFVDTERPQSGCRITDSLRRNGSDGPRKAGSRGRAREAIGLDMRLARLVVRMRRSLAKRKHRRDTGVGRLEQRCPFIAWTLGNPRCDRSPHVRP